MLEIIYKKKELKTSARENTYKLISAICQDLESQGLSTTLKTAKKN